MIILTAAVFIGAKLPGLVNCVGATRHGQMQMLHEHQVASGCWPWNVVTHRYSPTDGCPSPQLLVRHGPLLEAYLGLSS